MLLIQNCKPIVAELLYPTSHRYVFSSGISKEIMTSRVVNKALELKALYEGFVKG